MMEEWASLLYALLLLLVGIALLILDFFIVSFGLLSVAALASVVFAINFAFQIDPLLGYGLIVFATLITVITVRWGFARLRSSNAIPKAEINGDAGYHHLAERLGVEVGSQGVMVTPALPSGRARFKGGECDVQVRSGSLDINSKVVVERIDGPIIFVNAAELNRVPTSTV